MTVWIWYIIDSYFLLQSFKFSKIVNFCGCQHFKKPLQAVLWNQSFSTQISEIVLFGVFFAVCAHFIFFSSFCKATQWFCLFSMLFVLFWMFLNAVLRNCSAMSCSVILVDKTESRGDNCKCSTGKMAIRLNWGCRQAHFARHPSHTVDRHAINIRWITNSTTPTTRPLFQSVLASIRKIGMLASD